MKRIGLVAVIILIMTCIIPTTAIVAVASSPETTYTIFTAKAYGDRVGGHVNVYVLPSTDAEIKCTMLDGTKMTVAKSEYEGYYEVVLEDGIGFVKEENVTTSISYNERVALIIGIVACVTVILILLITYFRRNADYLKSKRK